jgi:hypothetical protein
MKRTIELIDQWGNKSQIEQHGKMNRTKHSRILAALEKRALRYRNKAASVKDSVDQSRFDTIDETGTVDTAGLTDDSTVRSGDTGEERDAMANEMEEVAELYGILDELLRVHGVAPGSKADGVVRLMYENLNGLLGKISGNEKLEKAKSLIDELEADVVCYNEHRQNLMHKSNTNGFAQMFRGGEAEIRAVAGHNTHEGKQAGRVQEGGTAMLCYGELIEVYDSAASGKDDSGFICK